MDEESLALVELTAAFSAQLPHGAARQHWLVAPPASLVLAPKLVTRGSIPNPLPAVPTLNRGRVLSPMVWADSRGAMAPKWPLSLGLCPEAQTAELTPAPAHLRRG